MSVFEIEVVAMKNLTAKLSGVTIGLMMVGAVHADQFDATATVSSAITLVETTALDLGTLFMPDSNCSGTGSFMTVPTDGSSVLITGGTGNCAGDDIVSLAAGTAGLITITGAAAFGTVTVDSSTAPLDLVHFTLNGTLPVIVFTTLTTLPTDGNTVTLDANGDGGIVVGGVFTAEVSNANGYQDGLYTGNYDIDVSY